MVPGAADGGRSALADGARTHAQGTDGHCRWVGVRVRVRVRVRIRVMVMVMVMVRVSLRT